MVNDTIEKAKEKAKDINGETLSRDMRTLANMCPRDWTTRAKSRTAWLNLFNASLGSRSRERS